MRAIRINGVVGHFYGEKYIESTNKDMFEISFPNWEKIKYN